MTTPLYRFVDWVCDSFRFYIWPGYATPPMLQRMAARDLAWRKRMAIKDFADKLRRAANDGDKRLVVHTWPFGDDTREAVADYYVARGYRRVRGIHTGCPIMEWD